MGSSTRKATASHVSALPDDRLEAIAREIETLQADAILHVAERLAEAREIFRYRRDEGGFGGWVESRLHYSRATAYNVLGIYERFGGECVQYLDTFPASILYLLAAPSTPADTKAEAPHDMTVRFGQLHRLQWTSTSSPNGHMPCPPGSPTALTRRTWRLCANTRRLANGVRKST